MSVEIVSEFPKRVNIGHLNKTATSQLNDIMAVYQIDNARHMLHVLIESLHKAIKPEKVE